MGPKRNVIRKSVRQLHSIEIKEIETAFKTIAGSLSSKINVYGLRCLFEGMGISTSENQAQKSMYTVDIMDSGWIGYEDFKKLYAVKISNRTCEEELEEMFNAVEGHQRKGYLTFQSLQKLRDEVDQDSRVSDQELIEMWTMLDKEFTCKLYMQEMMEIMK